MEDRLKALEEDLSLTTANMFADELADIDDQAEIEDDSQQRILSSVMRKAGFEMNETSRVKKTRRHSKRVVGFIIAAALLATGAVGAAAYTYHIDNGAVNTDLFYGVWIQGEIVVSDDGTVSGFTDINGKMEIKSVNEIYDEMISASSSISFVDKSIADNMECRVDDVSLVQIRQYSENERTPKDIKELDQSNNDSEYVTHPYWQIMMTSVKSNDKRYVALVDCITGEFAFTSIL